MTKITKALSLLSLVFFFLGNKTASAQSITFNWNGSVVFSSGYPQYYNGTIQTWTVPSCVTTITVTATGGSGGGADYTHGNQTGGLGARLTGTVPVTSGHVLDIVVGAMGAYGGVDGGGGGGGSYVWDNTTSTLLVVAGGGSGAGDNEDAPNGEILNTTAATLETPTRDVANTCGANGTGGGIHSGGRPGTTVNKGSACGGAGWGENGVNVGAGSTYYAGGGVYPDSAFTRAYGGLNYGSYTGDGGFGGGGGGGYNSGGGGGGYNGGAGGTGYTSVQGRAGGGGGSFFNNTIASATSLGNSGADGSVVISWSGSGVTATISAFTNVSCHGGSNGTATVTAAGSTPPYTYLWNPSAQTNATATGLSAGTYTVTVTSHAGCTATASVTITQPTQLTATISATVNVPCNGGVGSATVTAGGGTPGYTYVWNPSAQTNTTATGLTAGSYTVTVTDHNGCTATASVNITQPAILTATISSSTNPACHGGTGTATVTAAGGTTNYTYVWTPSGGTNSVGTGLTAGSYTVTVTDAHGCTATASVTLTQPTALTATISATTNASCNGGTGSATVTAAGGTSPYAYIWNPSGQTNANATGLTAGSYTVTVTDHDGCTATASVTITQPTTLTATITASVNVPCNGGSNGTATVTAGGGTPGYTYVWNPSAQTNTTATGLTAGSYTVTVTDHNGCTATASVNITQPAILTATISSSTNPACHGGTGTATVTAAGGTTNYTYVWTPSGGTNSVGTGLTAGSYTVTVTDAHGCTATASVTLTQPTALTATISATTNASCNGGTGSATVTAAGGTSPYAYIWNPSGQTNANATGLTAGSYTVTVTDHDGCTATASVTITQPTTLTATITASVNVPCNGGSNGTATVTAGGGTPGYTYVWNPSAQTNTTATGLTAGSYTVTVTDHNGCTASASVTLTQPSAVTAAISGSTGVNCNGGSNGTATVVAGGGTSPYAYVWTPSGGTNATGTGLSAGTYTATVTDAHGCTATASVIITQPAVLLASISSTTNVSCNGGTGSSTVTATGGTTNYTYIWSPSGGTNATGTGLTAGSYTVTVTDAHGCTATASVTITQPATLNATITATVNVPCNGGVGSATVTATGGTTNYIYNWTPSGGTNAMGTGLTAGSYTVTVTDAHGCTASTSVNITQPTVLSVSTSFTHASCNLPNGTATAIVTGGTSPYTYIWNPSSQTTATATALNAGSYTVIVTDNNHCTASASVTVTQPSAVTATISGSTGVSCNGGSNGTATVVAGGGTSPYAYIWTPSGGTNATGTGLSAGTYVVTVTDANGCTVSTSVNITQPTPLTATISSATDPACHGGTGTATVTAAGGTTNYTYAWTPSGGTNATGTGLTAGSYTVTVTDAHGCTATATINIVQPTQLTATMGLPNNVLCNGGTGNAIVTAGGGTSPYAYNWNPSGQTTAIATGLSAGSYTVTVRDANGCTVTGSVTITQPTALTISTSFIHASCNLPNGSATAIVTGGTIPYAYVWTPSGETTATANGLNAGTYTIVVTDANHCTISASVTVTQPSAVTASVSTTTGVSCKGGRNGTATAVASGGNGPYNYLWTPGGNTNAYGTGLSAGTYIMTITDANGCTASASGIITEPTALTVTVTGQQLLCQGSAGNFTANASGGTLPYAYSWSSGATSSIATVIPSTPQTYTVTVTDVNGCTATGDISINFGPPLLVTATGTASVCSGASGNICASASGGTGGDNYLWQPGNLTTPCITVSPLSTSTYTVTVTDNCGATATTSATVHVSSFPTVGFSADIYVGCAPLCIQFRNTTQGNAAQYVWAFGNGDTVQSASPIYCYPSSGTYNVSLTVTDSSGCSATLQKNNMITVYTHPNAAFTFSPQTPSILAPTVQFTDKSTDQYGIAYHSWHFGDASDSTSKMPNPTHTYQDTGSYCANLVVMNEYGCTDTATNCLVISPAFNLYIPSAFSPNGDGINDVFQPVGKYIQSFEMYIFDRWGMQMYHTTDITKGWNGTVAGGSTIAQEDTYIYKILVTDSQGNQHSYVGNVSIVK